MPPLRILLTNDDGIDSPALWRLRERLLADGHDVAASAPARDCSGASASFAYFSPYTVRRVEDQAAVWSVDGPPVVAALHGLDHSAAHRHALRRRGVGGAAHAAGRLQRRARARRLSASRVSP
jgi:5'/3'-nucleotidase SurE